MEDLYPTRGGDGFKIRRIKRDRSWSKITNAMEDDGFVVLPEFFSSEMAGLALSEARSLAQHASDGIIHEPRSKVVRSIFGVHECDQFFKQMSTDQRLMRLAYMLLGGNVYIHQSRVNFKQQGGIGWGWHSDFETWHAEDGMPGMDCFTAMVALTPNTKENGALKVIPRSHHYYISCPGETPQENWTQSLVDQKVGVPSDEILSELKFLCGADESTLELSPGDVVLFHCNLMHGSTLNESRVPRTNLFFVYNDIGNALVAPFSALAPRPLYAGSRAVIPY